MIKIIPEKELKKRTKPCACGNKDLIVSLEGTKECPLVFILCKNCKASLFDDMLIAIKRWNKRDL